MEIPTTLKIDEFGRPNGFLIVNKAIGESSHNVVDKVRKLFHVRKVGHSGALDPFASGVLIILVGKDTKKSDHFLNLPKKYRARVLFGISTRTQDIEGEVTNVDEDFILQKAELEKILGDFVPEYQQFVPVFSSVKVNGQKLRKLAHAAKEIEIKEKKNGRTAIFTNENDEETKVDLPQKLIKISQLKIVKVEELKSKEILKLVEGESLQNALGKKKNWWVAEIDVDCSKGTYIRQLAEDIGAKLETPAMLIGLKRLSVGEYKIEDAVEIKEEVLKARQSE